MFWVCVFGEVECGVVVGVLICVVILECDKFLIYLDLISIFMEGFFICNGYWGFVIKIVSDVVG